MGFNLGRPWGSDREGQPGRVAPALYTLETPEALVMLFLRLPFRTCSNQ